MDPTLKQRNVFSNNTLSVSGDDVRAQWIFGSEPVFSQRTFQASLQRRRVEKHTGLWFLDGEAFYDWQAQPRSFLWLHGKTGCGKTMLCSSAIDRLQNSGSSNQALIYHFFTVTHQRSRTSDTLVRTLVHQLAGHNDETRARARELYNQAGEDDEPADCDQLLSVFEDLSKLVTQVYVVIDSLDECVDQDETCALLEELRRNVRGIRILASSNTTQTRETEAALNKLKTSKIYVTTNAVNGDIEAHIRKMDLAEWEETQKDSIVRHITAGSDGSFRWAVGQLLEIKKCDTELELDKALKSLPESLTETHERILSGFTTDSDIRNLKILLCWLLYAARPLRIEELRQTVAISWLHKPYFDEKKRLNQRPRIFDQYTFLIAIDEDSEESDIFALDDDEAATHEPRAGPTWHKDAVLRLAHSSVFQFLQETENLSAHARRFSTAQPAGDLMLAQSSLAYILSLDSTETQTLATVPLFDYAIHNWYTHAQKAGPGNTEVLGALIREALDTRWDIYRLVTYPNPSTRYNPWARPQITTPDYADHVGQGDYLHGTYDHLVISADPCKLCKMIHRSLIQFALARYCQIHAESTLYEEDSERLGLVVDEEIHLNAGGAEVWLKAETNDPVLLISCYCYFGRLHLFTNPEQSSPRSLPKMVIEVGVAPVRLLDTQGMPRESRDRYVTLSHYWGRGPWPPMTTRANFQSFMHDMPLDILPYTYRAAIKITRHLGIRYLWIDTLCMVPDQEDQEDFVSEVAKMSDYFSNATLSIVAGVPDLSTSIFLPRVPPRFSPIRLNASEDLFLGWLGTESYCDPRGLNADRYPDGWRYKTHPHTRAWNMQEIRLARRNLVFQADEGLLTSQLYMQCQEEVRWENGRTRRRTIEDFTDWYEQVEEYSGRQLMYWHDRLPAFSSLARNYLLTTGGQCGQYLAGLWSEDLFRGLLWRAHDARTAPPTYQVPSWSWASVNGKVKHVWPLNATVFAEALEYCINTPGADPFDQLDGGFILIRGSLVQFQGVNGALAAWAGEVTVNIYAEKGYAAGVRVYYYLDHPGYVNFKIDDLYGLKITRRVALLLEKAHQDDHVTRRVGLMIVAKPDTQKWASVYRQCDVKIV
ncbi:hypothetical protein V8F06_007765 [Rhypophila decipiens]